MDIVEIRKRIRHGKYEISYHAEKERYSEDITLADIETAVLTGEILEYYPDDQRGPSCLILGWSKNRPIHIVCCYTTIKWIRIITVYLPKQPKWLDEKTRAKGR